MIILIGGEKGGTGKSTLACNLAALRASEGNDVLLVDTDPQGSAAGWAAVRSAQENLPRVPCVQIFGKTLGNELRDLQRRYTDIVVDAGGRDSIELRAALVVAQKAYIPITPSQFDIWTLKKMDEIVSLAHGLNPELQAFILMSRAATNPFVKGGEQENATEVFEQYESLRPATSIFYERISYRVCAVEGRSVAELGVVNLKAVQDLKAIYSEVFANGQVHTTASIR